MGEGMTYEIEYKALLWDICQQGAVKKGRNGETRSLFGQTLTVNLKHGFPVLNGRKLFIQGIFGELAGFLRGAKDLKTYKDFGCNYWDANAAAWQANNGLPWDKQSIGQYVGPLWRDFRSLAEIQSDSPAPRDQLAVLVEQLKTDPQSRRHVLSAWHPGASSCLPPCTVMAIFNVQNGVLHCHVTQRSADMCLGVPSDVVQYALLVHLLCKEVGLVPGKLMFTFVDAHVYQAHMEPLQQYFRQPAKRQLPKLKLKDSTSVFGFVPSDAELVDYEPSPAVKFPFVV